MVEYVVFIPVGYFYEDRRIVDFIDRYNDTRLVASKVTKVTIEQDSFASRELIGKTTNVFNEMKFAIPGGQVHKEEKKHYELN